jgi:maleate cis-trans isomerase
LVVTGVDSVRLGFLYPGYAAEGDYPELVRRLPVPAVAEVVHTSVGEMGDLHTVEALHAMGEHERLAEGAAVLRARGVAATMWACTSGSFVYGWEGAGEQAALLGEQAGTPASSTSFAFVRAARFLRIRRVAVAATYPAPVAQRFVSFLRAGGIEVAGLTPNDVMTATEAGEMTDDETVAMILAGDRPEAEAIFVPDTALRTAHVLPRLIREAGKPVLTANQVTVWEAARLASEAGQGNFGGFDAGWFLVGDMLAERLG